MAILESGRIYPPGLPSQDLIHVEARDARDALWAMEEGLRCSGLSCVIGELWGDPAQRSISPRPGGWRSRPSAAGVPCWLVRLGGTREPQRRADALADRERAVADQPVRCARAGAAGLGRRAVPRSRGPRRGAGASPMKRVLPSGCRSWRSSAGRRRATDPPDAPVVLTVEGTHGPLIHAVTQAAAERGARAGARLTDARALDPALIAVPADPARRCGVGEAARAVGRALVAAGRGRRRRAAARRERGRASVRRRAGAGRRSARRVSRRWGSPTRIAHCSDRRARPGRWSPLQPLHLRPRTASGEACRLARRRLRLDPDTVRTLERLGLKTIGALHRHAAAGAGSPVPRATDVVDALDRALGRKAEPLTAAPADPPPRALLRLEEPATHPEAGGQALERLIPELVRQLEERRLGARAAVADRLPGRRQRRDRPGRDRDPQPRAEASAAAARRQGGRARPRVRLRRLRARSANGPRTLARRRKAWSRSPAASARSPGWSTG